MIIWGNGGDNINLGRVDTRLCGICGMERPFSLLLQYRYFHLYWIFGIVTSRKYLMICDVCHNGWELDAKEMQKTIKNDPIPATRRYGLMGLLLLPFSLIILASIVSLITSVK